MKKSLSTLWNDNKGLFAFIVLMLMFRSAVADWNDVPTGSMKPTIIEGDRIFVDKLAYDVTLPFTSISLHQLGHPERGDVVVFVSEKAQERLVKRVIGVPGDTVAMVGNQLVLNGKPLQYTAQDSDITQYQEYTEHLPQKDHFIRLGEGSGLVPSFNEVRVPEEYYLVLGDNRDNSADSRMIGLVPRNEIVGRANYVVMSLDYDNYFLPRTDRFMEAL